MDVVAAWEDWRWRTSAPPKVLGVRGMRVFDSAEEPTAGSQAPDLGGGAPESMWSLVLASAWRDQKLVRPTRGRCWAALLAARGIVRPESGQQEAGEGGAVAGERFSDA